jgi:hypothetical protein
LAGFTQTAGVGISALCAKPVNRVKSIPVVYFQRDCLGATFR